MISWLASFLIVIAIVIIVIVDCHVFKGKIFWAVIIAFALFMFTALVHDMILGG